MRSDSEKCEIVSIEEIKKIDTKNLEYICTLHTPNIKGFSIESVKKKLRKYMENKAYAKDANIAVIKNQCNHYHALTKEISYNFFLCRYKNQPTSQPAN